MTRRIEIPEYRTDIDIQSEDRLTLFPHFAFTVPYYAARSTTGVMTAVGGVLHSITVGRDGIRRRDSTVVAEIAEDYTILPRAGNPILVVDRLAATLARRSEEEELLTSVGSVVPMTTEDRQDPVDLILAAADTYSDQHRNDFAHVLETLSDQNEEAILDMHFNPSTEEGAERIEQDSTVTAYFAPAESFPLRPRLAGLESPDLGYFQLYPDMALDLLAQHRRRLRLSRQNE